LVLLIGVLGGRAGHPWNFGQTARRSLGHRGAATPQQELSVVDDPGTFSVKGKKKRMMTIGHGALTVDKCKYYQFIVDTNILPV